MATSAKLPPTFDPESLAAMIAGTEAPPAILSHTAAGTLVLAGALIAYQLREGGHGYRVWLRTPDSRRHWAASDYLGAGTTGFVLEE